MEGAAETLERKAKVKVNSVTVGDRRNESEDMATKAFPSSFDSLLSWK